MYKKKNYFNNCSRVLLPSLLAFLLIGCGDDTTATSHLIQEGVFLDSAVEGVAYNTASKSGVTDANGNFEYNKSDRTIEFHLGNLKLADFSLAELKSDKKLLPADLFQLKRENVTDARLLKLIRVLQSLDEDNNASNGIFITDNTKCALSLALDNNSSLSKNLVDNNISALQTLIKATGKKLILENDAKKHYKSTLNACSIVPEFAPFVTVWEMNATDKNITIKADPNYSYDYTIEWGDGDVNRSIAGDITHTYSDEGNYTVKISGEFPHFYIVRTNILWHASTEEKADAEQLKRVSAWGDIAWKSMDRSFGMCRYLELNATDTPDLSQVTTTREMFAYALTFNQPIDDWDVSHVRYMTSMFRRASSFNQALNEWNVSNVSNMWYMFGEAVAFNQPLNNWDVSHVEIMGWMFSRASSFDQPLNEWNVSNVTDMDSMFSNAEVFNQDISDWNVSSVTDMSGMFASAKVFNQNISNWDVSSVTNLEAMFTQTGTFNQPLNDWNVSSVTHIDFMFNRAAAFNQPLNNWDVSHVENMIFTFSSSPFNQNISDWNVSSVTDMQYMFKNAEDFNQNLEDWNVSSVTNMRWMFNGASSFSHNDLSGWDVRNVFDHTDFMQNSGIDNVEPNWQ